MSELCRISTNLKKNNCWKIHDKIAETLCLVLRVCHAPRTQALRRRRHWLRAASTIDWTKRPLSLIKRISSSLTLAIVVSVNFLLQYTPDAIVDWVQIW